VKDFIVYMQPIYSWRNVANNITVDDLRSLSGTGRLRELEVVKEGKIKLIKEYDGLRLFSFCCRYQSEKSRSSVGEAPIQDLEFEIYQKKNGLVAVIQAPKKAARIAASVLSYLSFEDPFLVTPFQLSILDFRKLISTVQKYSGKLTRFSLSRVEGEKGTLRKFEVSGDFEQVLNVNIDTILGSARRVNFMGFNIPSFKDSGTFSFRITEWGGGQIYQPQDPQPYEISELMGILEEAFLT
jgi:hypothetical protein